MTTRVPRYGMWIRWSDEDHAFVSQCLELDGCSATGETPLEAATELQTAIALAVETLDAHHHQRPPEQKVLPFSGQFRLRIPVSLHAALADRAAREGVSLNTLAATLLAAAVGHEFTAVRSLTAQRRDE
jgi:antitoxin HicB